MVKSEGVYPTKEDIAKILSETITFTGQVGIINIHHTINRLHELFHQQTKEESEQTTDENQLSIF